MQPREIRAELIRRGITYAKIQASADCTMPEISMCISGDRIYPKIRNVIAELLKRPVDQVFGKHHPQPKTTNWCKAA